MGLSDPIKDCFSLSQRLPTHSPTQQPSTGFSCALTKRDLGQGWTAQGPFDNFDFKDFSLSQEMTDKAENSPKSRSRIGK
jgi:hypothetical protein